MIFGFANKNYPNNKLTGHSKDSYGYRVDGKLFHKKASLEKTLPKVKDGDVVGCGINFFTREIFFTYNGVNKGNKILLLL